MTERDGDMKRLEDNEKGSIVVIAALIMVALIGIVGLLVEVGMLYTHRSRLQREAETLREVVSYNREELILNSSDPGSSITSFVRSYAAKFGIKPSEVTVTYREINTGSRAARKYEYTIRVAVPYNYTTLKVYGFTVGTIRVESRQTETVSRSGQMWKP